MSENDLGLDLAHYFCELGHRWDVWGNWTRGGGHEPESLAALLCPTCDSVREKVKKPEDLT